MVGTVGFEPTTLWSQTRCATRLRYAPSAGYKSGDLKTARSATQGETPPSYFASGKHYVLPSLSDSCLSRRASAPCGAKQSYDAKRADPPRFIDSHQALLEFPTSDRFRASPLGYSVLRPRISYSRRQVIGKVLFFGFLLPFFEALHSVSNIIGPILPDQLLNPLPVRCGLGATLDNLVGSTS